MFWEKHLNDFRLDEYALKNSTEQCRSLHAYSHQFQKNEVFFCSDLDFPINIKCASCFWNNTSPPVLVL